MASFVRSTSVTSNGSNVIDMCEESVNDIQMEGRNTVTPIGPEKRHREDSDEKDEDEGFITVNRRPTKRLLRSFSDCNDQAENSRESFQVRLSSLEILPKQFSLAKLLKSESIENILKVKYTSPYKVNILFKTEEDANKLLNCKRFNDNNYRCQNMHEVNISYGVVRDIDLEIEEKEILEEFTCEHDIVSVRRLKRLTEEGQWVDSSVVRLAFKSSTLPPYVLVYGCPFKVKPYVFPVTQCAGCWKYGHMKKYCTTRKIVCPKCGQRHENCETKQFCCINCKGAHMALDKNCPIFMKEKKIKSIMSANNCTYKKALTLYQQHNIQARITNSQYNYSNVRENEPNNPTYRDILVDNMRPQTQVLEEDSHDETDEVDTIKEGRVSHTRKKNKQKSYRQQENEVETEEMRQSEPSKDIYPEETTKKREKRSKFSSFLYNLKEIIFSQKNFKEKVYLCLQFIVKEVSSLICDTFMDGKLLELLYKNLYNG